MLDASTNELSHVALEAIAKLLRMPGMERSGRRRSIEGNMHLMKHVTSASLGMANMAKLRRSSIEGGTEGPEPLWSQGSGGHQQQQTSIRDLILSGNPLGNKVRTTPMLHGAESQRAWR